MKVYFKEISQYSDTKAVSLAGAELLDHVLEDSRIELPKEIPLKVHFGEKGNKTFIEPKNFDSIIGYLKSKQVNPFYTETNVLYSGSRMRRADHVKLAQEHGFNQIPIRIADGDRGVDFIEIKIDKKHFKACKIGSEIKKHRTI